MASRPRTRSWSQSEDDSDTPSLTHGDRMTRSKRKTPAVLETVIASPEPEPAKKLSFTPAADATPRSAKKSESAKKSATKGKTPNGKAPAVLEPIPDESAPSPPKSQKKKKADASEEDNALKSVKSAKKSAKIVEEVVEEPEVEEAIPKAPKSAKKSAKKAPKAVEEEVEEEPVADATSSKKIKSAQKSAKKAATVAASIAESPIAQVVVEAKTSSKKAKKSQETDNASSQALAVVPESKSSKRKRKSLEGRQGKLQEMIDGTALLKAEEKKRWQMNIHRCRFVGWMPDPIHTLIALPAHLNGNVVAVSRAGGDLELVNVDERWSVTSRVHGPAQGTHAAENGGGDVRALAWVLGGTGVSNIKGLSLIGATLRGTLFEADFRTGLRRRERDSMGGSVWALASPPYCGEIDADMSTLVAAGCEDGTIRMFQLNEDEGLSGGLELVRTLGPVGCRIASLSWAKDAKTGGVGYLYAGTADGTIHRFDSKTWRNDGRMTLDRRGSASGSGRAGGKPNKGGEEDCVIVWALKALSDGTLVSGDSGGYIQFWDGLSCTHSSRVETHTADVLCLAVSDDEKCVFASGMDHKVACLRRLSALKGEEEQPQAGVWSLAHAYRAHQLDVRALAIVHLSKSTAPEHNAVGPWNPNKPNRDGSMNLAHREILVSGGLDTKLCTYHVRNFSEHRPKRIWPFPYHAVVSLSAPRRLLLAQHRDKLELFQLPARDSKNESKEGNQRLLCELKMSKEGGSGIICSAVSQNGCFIAASDAQELRLFRLRSASNVSSAEGMLSSVRIKKLPLDHEAMTSAQLVCFANNRLISATRSGMIYILRLPTENSTDDSKIITVEHSFSFCGDVAKAQSASSSDDDAEVSDDKFLGLPFTCLAVSSDGAWLAAAGTGNHVLLYSLDSMSMHWKLPTGSSRVTSLAFPPLASSGVGQDSTSLVLASVDNRIHVYDVEARQLAEWSRENAEKFPSQLRFRSDPVVGVAFRPSSSGGSDEDESSKLLLRSHGFLCFVDLGAPIPSNARIHPSSHLAAKNDVARRLRHIEQRKRREKMAARLLLEKKLSEREEDSNKRLRSNSTGSEVSMSDIVLPDRARSDSITSISSEKAGVEAEEAEDDDMNRNFAITLKYRPVIFADYLSSNELVVVEEPWLKIMNKLPDPLFRQRYGT